MQIRLFRLPATVLAIFILQAGLSQRTDSMMAVYAQEFPTEKIHIHFDKSIYNKEETIWYKIYLLSGTELSGL
ncbi:MAG: hypothetical protein Q8R50_06780, partial [Sediminibacterium sp.]|nr:hypothetical protein [Sediminibacterium sp.]